MYEQVIEEMRRIIEKDPRRQHGVKKPDCLGVKAVPQSGRSGSDAAISPFGWQECERSPCEEFGSLQNVSSREGRGTPIILSAVLTILCRHLRSDILQLPYQEVMQLVRTLLIVP